MASVTIPATVTSLGKDVLLNTAWYNNQAEGFLYLDGALYGYKGTIPENLTIEELTTGILGSAFSGCTSLTSVTIPSSVTRIDDYAFEDCSNLTTVTAQMSLPPRISDNVFPSQLKSSGTLITPSGAETNYLDRGWARYFHSIGENVWLTINNLSDISNYKQYYICTRNWQRGTLGVLANGGALASTNEAAKNSTYYCDEPSPFAIIQYNGEYYLYSVKDHKFIKNSGGETDTPGINGTHAISPYKREDFYVIDFKVTGNTLNVNKSPGIAINSYGTKSNDFDDGNQFSIVEIGDFDPSEALEMFNTEIKELRNGEVYWLQDTETGKFLSQGGNWGTQAVLQDVGGLGFEAAYVSDGVYQLKNIMWNKVNNSNLGLGKDGYCDQSLVNWTVTPNNDGFTVGNATLGKYLSNGETVFSTEDADAATWRFLTKSEYDAALQARKADKAVAMASQCGFKVNNLAELEDLLNDPTYFKVTDMTSSIANPNLNLTTETISTTNSSSVGRWRSEIRYPEQRTYSVTTEYGTCGESWNALAYVHQTIQDNGKYLHAGIYKISFAGSFRPKGKTESERLTSAQTSSPAYVFANDEKEEMTHWIDVSAKANSRTEFVNNASDYTRSFYVYLDGQTPLELGVCQEGWFGGKSWCPFGRFTLTRYVAVAEPPTSIALNPSEVVLDGDHQSATITLVLTPANSSDFVTWSSSDESVATVADGVVTAVSAGTVTITATSDDDPMVSGTATVTVAYPETAVPASTYENDGPTRYVYHYGKNLIKNSTFEYPNNFFGWTNGAGGQMSSSDFNIITSEGNKYLQATANAPVGSAKSIRILWPIESGKKYEFGYKVKANVAGKSTYHVVSMTNTAGVESSKVSNDATAVGTSWTSVKYEFTNTEGYAYLQFRARWLDNATSFDDFYLSEITTTTEGNVQYALDAIPNANVGTEAFQFSSDAVDAANALVQGVATVAEVQTAYDAMTVINAPAIDELYHVVLCSPESAAHQKAITYLAASRVDMGKYSICFQEEPNVNLAQAFTFHHTDGNKFLMSQIDANGEVRYLCTGLAYGGNTSQIRTTTDASKALIVEVIPTETEGVWNLKNTAADNYIGSSDGTVNTVNSHINFNIVETTKPSITVNTTGAKWGTLIVPFAIDALPDGVKAYTCSATDGRELTLVEVNTLKANKPYIIRGAWNETLTGDAQGTALSYSDGLLTGTYEDIDAPVGSYVLQKQDTKIGFFQVDDIQPRVRSNRAYLTAPSASVKAFYLVNDADAIKSVFDSVAKGDIYDLSGRKVEQMQKGHMYIINGKKVMVK